MTRWLLKFALVLAIAPIPFASASPTTQPDAAPSGPIVHRLPDIKEFKLFPNPRLNVIPPFFILPKEMKPHGQSFQFNGLTVYIEPIA
jgi:hypothetical protein